MWKEFAIAGLVNEERQGDGEELVSPMRDRILTKASRAKSLNQILNIFNWNKIFYLNL